MPCYYPLKGYVLGKDLVTGKKHIKVVSALDEGYPGFPCIPIPCGNCIGCRLDYAYTWANRCMLELQYHDEACFITLTYDDLHIPRVVKDGVMYYTLCKRDFQLFMKRLRRFFPEKKIRFFAAGEYGDETFRPHYHAILFGVSFPDLVSIGLSKTLNPMYKSSILTELWSMAPRSTVSDEKESPAGFCTVQDVTFDTCSYVARYVTKKLKGYKSEFYETRGIDPPFSLMSRRPGIGRQYLDDHPELWDSDYIHCSTVDGGIKFRPMKYFKRVRSEQDPIVAEEASAVSAAISEENIRTVELFSSLSYDEYLDRLARIKANKVKSLVRSEKSYISDSHARDLDRLGFSKFKR